MARRPRDPAGFASGDAGEGSDDGESAGGAASGGGPGADPFGASGSDEDLLGASGSDEDALADALTSESDERSTPGGGVPGRRRRPGEDTREVPRRLVDRRVKFPFGTSADDEDDLGASSRSLPSLPPGSRPEDDASLEGLGDPAESSEEGLFDSSDEDLVDLSDMGSISARVSDLGPISPSGPLVIIDDEDPGASMRYQASVVDDSARLAGRRGSLRAGRGERGGRRPRDPADEDVDADVPVPDRSARAGRAGKSGRRSGRVSGVGRVGDDAGAPAAAPSRKGMIARLALAFVAVGLALLAGELRLRSALEAERQRHAAEVAALKKTHADALERERRAAEDAAAGAKARAEQDARLALEQAAREAAAERERAVEAARREAAEAARAAAEREAREAVEVELARAREAAGADVDEAVRRAREDERAAAERALADLAAREEARRLKELEDLRAELQDELDAMETRAAEEYMARVLAEERAAALDRAQPAGGGSAAEGASSGGGDDWDQYFSGASSGGGGGGSGGGASDDPFAAASASDGAGGHVVDRTWAWLQENIHGSLGYRNLSHFSRGGSRNLRKTRHELRVKLEYRDWLWRSDDALAGLRLVSVLDLRVDDADYAAGWQKGIDDEERRRPHLWPEELHLDLTWDWLTVKAGYQIFAWGTGDLFNPTDVLNPIDFSDLFDTRRISVMSASVEVTFDKVSLELVSIPSFTRSRLPLRGERFDVLSGISPVPVLRPDDPDASVQNAQWGARLKGSAFGWDVSVSGFTGFDDLPTPRLAVRSLVPLDVVIDPVFDRFHMAGVDFATTLDFLGLGGKLGDVLAGIQLHGEAAHFFVEGQRQEDFLQYVLGLNYTWVDLIFEHDLTLVLEYAGDVSTSDADDALPGGVQLNRILRGAVLARLEYAVDEDLSFEVNAAVVTHGKENALIHPGVRWNVTDNLRLELGGDVFVGPEDTFFGQFRKGGRVIFDVKWVF